MTPIDAAILVLILALPLHWLVLRHFDRLADPAICAGTGSSSNRKAFSKRAPK